MHGSVLIRTAFFFLALTGALHGVAREPSKGEGDSIGSRISFGIDLGAYFANGATAAYYNGKGLNSVQELIDIPSVRRRIERSLGDRDFRLGRESLPQDMTYDVATAVGFHVRWAMKERMALTADIAFTSLKLSDRFTLLVDDPNEVKPVPEPQTISGKERRFTADLAFQYPFSDGPIVPYGELISGVAGAQLVQNRIRVEGQGYSIKDRGRDRRTRNQSPRNAISPSMGLGLGSYIDAGSSFTLDLVAKTVFDRFDLGDDPNYEPHWVANGMILIRVIYR